MATAHDMTSTACAVTAPDTTTLILGKPASPPTDAGSNLGTQSASKTLKRPNLDRFSRNFDILFLIFQRLKQDRDQTRPPSTLYAFPPWETSPHPSRSSTANSATVKTIYESRTHDLVQDALSKICRVNRAFAKVGLPFLWERPKIRTCRQLDRFAYTLEHHGEFYADCIREVVVRRGNIPDPHSKSLWWGQARCRAILSKLTTQCTRLRYLDCNWAGSPFDHTMIRGIKETSFTMLKALRLEPVKAPSKDQCLSEKDFDRLITCCPNLESLELEQGYLVSNRSVIHLLMTCQNLTHLVFPSASIVGWIDALDMGFGETLRSIKIYEHGLSKHSSRNSLCSARNLKLDDYSFRPFALQQLESIDLEIGCGDFVNALFSKLQLPALRSLRILHPSNSVLEILSQRLAQQLTLFRPS